ncbi:MAG: hypothetical protein V1810_02705 [Candidatus Beckwithbacteria bacterium]
MLEKFKSKITKIKNELKIRGEIRDQAEILKAMILENSRISIYGFSFELDLTDKMVVVYSKTVNREKFHLNFKVNPEHYSGPVMVVSFGEALELKSVPAVCKQGNGYSNRYVDYSPKGNCPSEFNIPQEQFEFLKKNGVPVISPGENNPYPENINREQAILGILQLMNAKNPNLGEYVQAVKAAAS